MTTNSSPDHSSNISYDLEYDTNFNTEFSSKIQDMDFSTMHVPDKICVVEGAEHRISNMYHSDDIKTKMNVPDRILVAGDNKHITMRESLPEVKYDAPFPYQYPNCVLEAPPDVLTVDEYPYPTVDLKPKTEVKRERKVALDQTLNSINDMNESTMSAGYTSDEEVAILRRQVRHLARRVLAIEQENQQHQQREMVVYSLGVAYFIIKGLLWLHRHF